MTGPTLTELSIRARDIFRLVVEGYIASGLPVGSKTLAGSGAVNLSPASIRSVLQELQDAGLLAAPHTSAGRMPTEVGLRLFVDGIMQVAEPSVAEREQIERGLASGGSIEAALAAATSALSELSAGAGVIMVPRREARLVQLSFVPLGPARALAVMVADHERGRAQVAHATALAVTRGDREAVAAIHLVDDRGGEPDRRDVVAGALPPGFGETARAGEMEVLAIGRPAQELSIRRGGHGRRGRMRGRVVIVRIVGRTVGKGGHAKAET